MADEQQQQAQPDMSVPSPERQAELETAYERQNDTESPYKDVEIKTLGELQWIMQQRQWSGELSMLPGMRRANLSKSYIIAGNFSGVHLYGANLFKAHLYRANLSEAYLPYANLSESAPIKANLSKANLFRVNLSEADLSESNFNSAICHNTMFVNIDLRSVQGLTTIVHRGPSFISIDTLFRSAGVIPEEFLLGCGIPEPFVTLIRSFPFDPAALTPPPQKQVFISYSRTDSIFVDTLEKDLQTKGKKTWIDRSAITGGARWLREIQTAIDTCDVMLVLLSPKALESEYVETEYHYAHQQHKPIIPLLLQPCRLPMMLSMFQVIDFHQAPYPQALEALITAIERQKQP